MSIEILNRPAAWIAVGLFVGLPAAGYGVYRGVEYGFHVNHTMHVHRGQNLTYSVTDCQVQPGGNGTEWSSTVWLHNGNPDHVDEYGVQVEFLSGDKPVAWSKITGFGDLGPGGTKTLSLKTTMPDGSTAQVSCVAKFYTEDGDWSAAGDTSPVKV